MRTLPRTAALLSISVLVLTACSSTPSPDSSPSTVSSTLTETASGMSYEEWETEATTAVDAFFADHQTGAIRFNSFIDLTLTDGNGSATTNLTYLITPEGYSFGEGTISAPDTADSYLEISCGPNVCSVRIDGDSWVEDESMRPPTVEESITTMTGDLQARMTNNVTPTYSVVDGEYIAHATDPDGELTNSIRITDSMVEQVVSVDSTDGTLRGVTQFIPATPETFPSDYPVK